MRRSHRKVKQQAFVWSVQLYYCHFEFPGLITIQTLGLARCGRITGRYIRAPRRTDGQQSCRAIQGILILVRSRSDRWMKLLATVGVKTSIEYHPTDTRGATVQDGDFPSHIDRVVSGYQHPISSLVSISKRDISRTVRFSIAIALWILPRGKRVNGSASFSVRSGAKVSC